jgi:RNA polymerase sigma factor (sigma-70 family)
MSMRFDGATYFFPGAFAPTLSLDALFARTGAEGFNNFDIADADSLTQDEMVAQAEGLAAVDTFVSALPPRDRTIVERLFWLGHTQTQIAADLGVSKMAISKAVARICRLGRERLAEHKHLAFLN